jgi:hypothetical protein
MTILEGLEGTKIYKIQNYLNLESLKTLVINDDIFGNIDTVTDTDTNKLIIEKYIELYIKHTTNKTNYFDEAYFTELKTNVNLINNRLLIDTENINEIDMTFFANKKIIEYIFLSNFLSNVYESKAKQAQDYKNPNVGKITVKLRTVNSDIDTNDYISTYNYFKGREKQHSFIPINFRFQNAYRGNNYNSILADNISEEFEDSSEKKDEYKATFGRMLNKIDFKGKFLDLDSNLDYYKLLLLSYKYNLYSVLINYNIIQLYYAHIKFKSGNSSSDIIKYSEIHDILKQFNNVFKTNEYKFQQLDIIMNSVDKLEYKAESEKIQIAKDQMNRLNEINNTITKSRDNVNKNKEKLITEKRDYNYNKYKIIIISIILLITFASYIISINYYSLETSKFLSLIVFVIVLTVLLFNYLIIKTTEHFEESEPVVTDETITSTSSSGIISYEEIEENIRKLLELKDQSNLDIQAYGTTNYGVSLNIYNDATSDPFQSLIEDSNLDDNIKNAAEATSNKTYQFKQVFDNLNSLIADAESEKIALELKQADISANLTTIETLLANSNTDITSLNELYNQRNSYIEELEANNTLLEGILEKKIELKENLSDEHNNIKEENETLLNDIGDLVNKKSGNIDELERLDVIRLNLIANIETYDKEIGKLNEMIEIERPKLKILKGEIESKKEEYNKTSLELVDKMEEIAELESKIGNNSLTIQIIAKKIIDEKERLQKEADDSKIEADAAKLEAELAKEELEKKIAELEYQIENAPIPRTYELYFDLNSNIIDNQIKKENFKNQIITDLTLLLTITSNRFLIQNILPDEEKVKLTLIFYPSRTTGIEAIKSDILIDTLQVYFASENTNKFAKLINTTYLKFITKIIMLTQTGEPDKEEFFLLDDQQNLMHVTGNINRLLSNNKNMLDGIKEIISRLELIETSPNTYYNEINPGIEKEVIKYTDIESQIDYNKNIFNSQINTLKHDNIDSFYIYKYISYITLLLSALFICYSYLNNYSLLIYIIFSIIFVIILFYLFLDIFKNVRRKPKNKYWEKPKYN